MYCPRAQRHITPQLCPSIILDTADSALFSVCHACPEGRRLVASVRGQRDDEHKATSQEEATMPIPAQPEQTPMASAQPEQQQAPAPPVPQKKPRARAPQRRSAGPDKGKVTVFDLAPVPVTMLAAEIRRRLPKSVIILFQ